MALSMDCVHISAQQGPPTPPVVSFNNDIIIKVLIEGYRYNIITTALGLVMYKHSTVPIVHA